MLIVPGISLKSLNPRFWDNQSEYYLPQAKALMVSYADFHASRTARKRAMDNGIHEFLGVPRGRVQVFLDNGAFKALSKEWHVRESDYTKFVEEAKPDWYPIPKDYIPAPSMSTQKQRGFYQRTMKMNEAYRHDGYVPILHVGRYLENYLESIKQNPQLGQKKEFGLGGLVPNLLRSPNAPAHDEIIESIMNVRKKLAGKRIHVFGIGGVSTLHVAALLQLDSMDSSGWRNRAIRGIIQLPGTGDRQVAKLGNWNVREVSKREIEELRSCTCPSCTRYGLNGLKKNKTEGFNNRAIHNLYILFEEVALIQRHLEKNSYETWYQKHLTNSIYKPLVDKILATKNQEPSKIRANSKIRA